MNSPGDFYVVDQACAACGMPQVSGPSVMSSNEEMVTSNHCFFKKQPETLQELQEAISAVCTSCFGSIRYAGVDKEILEEIVKRGYVRACDVLCSTTQGDPTWPKSETESS